MKSAGRAAIREFGESSLAGLEQETALLDATVKQEVRTLSAES